MQQYWDISVLCVEDEKILRTIYSRLLKDHFRVLTFAENGMEGYEQYKKLKPDLVITDIKMPLLNGLDMVRKIKRIDPEARIVIMSAYGESHYFIRAIENGVKSFLLKPIDEDKLFGVIGDQAKEILLRRSMLEEERKRKQAEESLKRNEAILQSVSDAAELLLREGYNEKTVKNMLAKLGKATAVSRVYIFENYKHNDIILTSQTFEWVAEGVSSQVNNPDLQNFPIEHGPFARWSGVLSKRKLLYGHIKDFPNEERELLSQQAIVSIMVVPVFVQNNWFGFMGFDDCVNERTWTAVEANTIAAAANILGAAIQRSITEMELLQLNAELENRVIERTKDLEAEIVERQYVEDMLRDSEEKYRLIFENANDGILLTNQGRIQFINPKTYELTGYYPKNVIGKFFTDFIHPDYRELVLNNHHKRLNGENVPESYDIQIIDIKGNNKWVELKSNLIKWDDSPSVLTFMTDIHLRKMAEEQLMQLNQNLEERVKEELLKREKQQQLILQKSRLESLGELSAGIAHEINQPLGGISLSLDNILYERNNNTLTDQYLTQKFELMFQDITRIRKIIQHVREFSRDDPRQLQAVNVSKVINNTLSFVNRLYIDHNIDLEIAIDNQHQLVMADAFRLEQVMLNLLSNAKYAVETKAKSAPGDYKKKISVRSGFLKNMIYIDVSDNGTGIKNAILNNIFDPFFTTKKAQEGTGLGLSISYGIIKDMQGEIIAESVENEFTKIRILLPEK
ncbi:MAG: response regulator [Bacteroidetes bacterium]|nr:response regulator [Bacteroidota bacterium]MBU1580661.1 response regulator [Bacteroidota bacterium]